MKRPSEKILSRRLAKLRAKLARFYSARDRENRERLAEMQWEVERTRRENQRLIDQRAEICNQRDASAKAEWAAKREVTDLNLTIARLVGRQWSMEEVFAGIRAGFPRRRKGRWVWESKSWELQARRRADIWRFFEGLTNGQPGGGRVVVKRGKIQ